MDFGKSRRSANDAIVADSIKSRVAIMGRTGRFFVVAGAALVIVIATFPFWAMLLMGPAVYIDSERATRTVQTSPDGSRIASIEEIEVGGIPNIVIIVRDWWLPSWYFTGCIASSHYRDVDVSLEWISNSSIKLTSDAEPRFWDAEMAPFRNAPCKDLTTKLEMVDK